MASNRRMGKKDSATFNAILDAAERVLRDDGYGAATSRRIAEEAGLKQQLAYYYFQTMDELLLATFRRRTERAIAKLEEEIAADRPIHSIWEYLMAGVNARLSFEFVALANHHEGIREEVVRFVGAARRIEAAAIARHFEERKIDNGPVTPAAAAFVMYAVSLMLRCEEANGVTEGHDDVRALVDWLLARL